MHVKVEIKNFVEINRISSNTCNRYKWIVIIKTKQKNNNNYSLMCVVL